MIGNCFIGSNLEKNKLNESIWFNLTRRTIDTKEHPQTIYIFKWLKVRTYFIYSAADDVDDDTDDAVVGATAEEDDDDTDVGATAEEDNDDGSNDDDDYDEVKWTTKTMSIP